MRRIVLTIIIIGLFQPLKAQRNNTDTTIYQFAEVLPEFPGENLTFTDYMAVNFKAPDNDCFVSLIRFSFVVEIDGTVSNKTVIINDGNIILRTGNEDIEACKQAWVEVGLDLLNNVPKQIPGKKGNENVRVKVTVPLYLDPPKAMWND